MITTATSNPIDLLKLVLQYQNWGDNQSGSPSGSALIRTGNVPGSFDSATLDPVRNIPVFYQIKDIESGYTNDLISSICQQFNLIQYTDSEGYECVKYMFAESSDSEIKCFIINDLSEDVGQLELPDSSEICCNPIINYAYDYASGEYLKSLRITNVQMSTYNSSYTSGFENSDGENYWYLCKNKLWPHVKRIEEMDDSLSDNIFISDYTGAIFRLGNIIRLMKACKINFTVPFIEGVDTKAGDIIQLNFPHLSTSGTLTYNAVVTTNTISKNSNSCSIDAMFLQDLDEELLGAWQNTYDSDTALYQDSYDEGNNIVASYDYSNNVPPLTYVDPSASPVHITQINDSLADLIANMDKCQIGIDTDHKQLLYTDDTNGFHYMLEGNGTQNRLLKYIDNYGHVGDSIIREVSGKIGIGLDAPLGNLHVHNPNSFASIVLSDINTGIDNGLELTTTSLTHKYDFFEIRDIPSVLYGTMAWLSKHTDRIDIGYSSHPELSPIYLNGTVTLNKIASASSSNILVLDGNNSICKTGLAGIGAEPAITAGNSAQYWRGDKTWQALNTTAVAEGTNLYFTNARVVSVLTSNYPDLVAIEALTGASGLLRKTAANTWSLDTTVYAPKGTIATQRLVAWNGSALVSSPIITDNYNIHIDGSITCTQFTDTALSGNKVVFANVNSVLTTTGIGTAAQFLKADGSLDSSVYLTGNQSITLSGVVSGSGTIAITTTIADNALSIAKTNGLQAILDNRIPLYGSYNYTASRSCGALNSSSAPGWSKLCSWTPATYVKRFVNFRCWTGGRGVSCGELYVSFMQEGTSTALSNISVIYHGENNVLDPTNFVLLYNDSSAMIELWYNETYNSNAQLVFSLVKSSLTLPPTLYYGESGTLPSYSYGAAGVSPTTMFDKLYLSNLTTGYLPYKNNSGYLANSLIYTNGTNVSIGNATVAPWRTDYQALQLGAAVTLFTRSTPGTAALFLSTNTYTDADGIYKAIFGSGSASSAMYATVNDTHYWFSNNGLSANVQFAPTNIMTLNSVALTVAGNVISDTWRSATYGGGWYMSDATWIRSYGNKSIYHNTGVLRTDGTLQVGPNGATMNIVYGGDATFGCNVLITGNINCNNIKTVYGFCYSGSQVTYTNATTTTWKTLDSGFTSGPLSGHSHSNGTLTLNAGGVYKIDFDICVCSSVAGVLAARISISGTSYSVNSLVYCDTPGGGSDVGTVTIHGSHVFTATSGNTVSLQLTNITNNCNLIVNNVRLISTRLSY